MLGKAISKVVAHGYNQWFGKAPEAIRVHISDCYLILEFDGILTPLEKNLLEISPSNTEVIRQIRVKIVQEAIDEFTENLRNVTGTKDLAIRSYTTDFNFEADQQIFVCAMNRTLTQIDHSNAGLLLFDP